MNRNLLWAVLVTASAAAFLSQSASAREVDAKSPDGRLAIVVSDGDSLQYRLDVDGKPVFHGNCTPTGLARTYPNFVTQEGLAGNEYNKLRHNLCTPVHTITLPFTRGLLGPMDFTPGGFLNRAPADFKITAPAQVMGTRARQLAETIVYPSPLTVICDSPQNYRGQPGIEFLRDLPTVWDDSVVLSGDVAKSIVLARRSGDR